MKLIICALLLGALWQAEPRVKPEPRFFRFERHVKVESGLGQRACAVLDDSLYAHARPALEDVRLFSGSTEVPYALTMSETAATGDAAKVLNQGLHGAHVVFDLEMPARPYTEVRLDLGGRDYLATARVTGLKSLADADGTALGTFTLFDLSVQRLGRSTTLALAESSFPYLHVDLTITGAAGQPADLNPTMVRGAEVPPSREAQTLYTTVAETTKIEQHGRESIAAFEVPAHVPVERITFRLEPADKTNFSRAVRITAKAEGEQGATSEELPGEISRVRMTEAGQDIRQETLSVPAILGSNEQTGAKVEVAVVNGDDRPLALQAVRLEMRERKLCFDAPAAPAALYYGDAKLQAPVYDYSRLFNAGEKARIALLEPETPNPVFVARTENRPLTERHPEIVWLALFAVVCVLGVVALRSAKRL